MKHPEQANPHREVRFAVAKGWVGVWLLTSAGFLWGVMKCLITKLWWWSYNLVNVLKSIELYSLNKRILWYINYLSFKWLVGSFPANSGVPSIVSKSIQPSPLAAAPNFVEAAPTFPYLSPQQRMAFTRMQDSLHFRGNEHFSGLVFNTEHFLMNKKWVESISKGVCLIGDKLENFTPRAQWDKHSWEQALHPHTLDVNQGK